MNKFFGLIFSAILFFAVANTASASGVNSFCQPTYGGGQVCENKIKFTVNKLVQNPAKGGAYVDNLTLKDAAFGANQTVNFQIRVTNTGSTKIDQLTVVDTLPAEVTFVSGPGSFDASRNTISFDIFNLEAGKEQVFTITGKVNSTVSKCPVNFVKVTAKSGEVSQDQSSFCIAPILEKPVMQKQPATGPEAAVALVMPAIGAAGFYLRRKFS